EDEIKLLDFGQTFYLYSPPDELATPLYYRAPEIVFHEKVDEKIDVWNTGMLACSEGSP
ncbi:hypothetical protein K470DRAFT_223186, partial [Piedraia hortae CBS 480.64]